jgi:predicted amidophosphoribosyltransferase
MRRKNMSHIHYCKECGREVEVDEEYCQECFDMLGLHEVDDDWWSQDEEPWTEEDDPFIFMN